MKHQKQLFAVFIFFIGFLVAVVVGLDRNLDDPVLTSENSKYDHTNLSQEILVNPEDFIFRDNIENNEAIFRASLRQSLRNAVGDHFDQSVDLYQQIYAYTDYMVKDSMKDLNEEGGFQISQSEHSKAFEPHKDEDSNTIAHAFTPYLSIEKLYSSLADPLSKITKDDQEQISERHDRDSYIKKAAYHSGHSGYETAKNDAHGSDSLWQKNAVKFKGKADKAKIVLIFDDMGLSSKTNKAIIDIDAPLTLAFLPYAEGAKHLSKRAQKQGHELIIHMPMEAINSKMDLGNIALHSGQDTDEFVAMIQKSLNVFDGYVGMNNHMGSKLTQDREAMTILMEILSQRGMAFVDSRTINATVAHKVAREFNMPTLKRDVFLDHDPGQKNVIESLALAESVALRKGYAVVIGHPKWDTINVVKKWIETLDDKDIEIAPLSSVLQGKIGPRRKNVRVEEIVMNSDEDNAVQTDPTKALLKHPVSRFQ